MSQTIQSKVITNETLRAVRTHARTASALVLAVQDYADNKAELNTDKKRERATNASAQVGAKMLAAKNALPTDPSKLRMHVESIKQKVQAIVDAMQKDETFANHCTRSAINKSATAALDSCATFIAEYKELKAADRTLTVAAKVA